MSWATSSVLLPRAPWLWCRRVTHPTLVRHDITYTKSASEVNTGALSAADDDSLLVSTSSQLVTLQPAPLGIPTRGATVITVMVRAVTIWYIQF